MPIGKMILRSAVLLVVLIVLGMVVLYLIASAEPAAYHPARWLTQDQRVNVVAKRFLRHVVMEFTNNAQVNEPFQLEANTVELNEYLASMDEIAASLPSGVPGDVNKSMDSLGLSDPAVALGDGVLTMMFLAKGYNKVVSADVTFHFTEQKAVQVRLDGTRVGRLPIPGGIVRGQLDRLKEKLQAHLERIQASGQRPPSRPTGGRFSTDDMALLLSTLIAAIDEEPIPAVIPKWRVRIDDIRIADDRVVLRFVPYGRENPRD